MKSRKILIILMLIIVGLIIVSGGLVFAYTSTDLLKTNQQLFYKYLGQAFAKTENIGSEELEQYFTKLQTTPYTSEGKLTAKVEVPEMYQEEMPVIKNVNDLNITYSGKNDIVNKKAENHIQINYSDDVTLPIDYKQDGNLYGLRSDLIVNEYLAVRNEKLDKLLEKFGITDVSIDEIFEPKDSNIDAEKLNDEFVKLGNIIRNNITDANFSKVDNGGYACTLNGQEVKKITIELLSELKNSDFITGETEEIEQTFSQVEAALENIEVTENENIKIIVYNNGTITIKIQSEESESTMNIFVQDTSISMDLIATDGSVTAKLTKQNVANGLTYRIDLGIKIEDYVKNDFYFQMTYSGLETQNVSEEYTLGMKAEMNDEETNEPQKIAYEYNLKSSKKFDSSIEFEQMENPIILNDSSKEYIENIMGIIGQRLIEVNANQMEQLGLSVEQNPLIYAIIGTHNLSGLVNEDLEGLIEANGEYEDEIEDDELVEDGEESIIDDSDEDNEGLEDLDEFEEDEEFADFEELDVESDNENEIEIEDSMSNAEKESFNAQFKPYEGTQSVTTVKSLIETIKTNNIINEDNMVSLNGMINEALLDGVASQLSSENKYMVNVEIDETTGLVNNVNISIV